ncbi:hypothetical protein Asp14428_22440 [Actinoplanes sp. NBRC 14428]|nr:hypothetical protein Asp14428_22440 [Actinoplanes sp. NBRC 14428]
MLVHHEARELLPVAAAADPGLGGVHAETLVGHHRGHRGDEPARLAAAVQGARERQVVRVAGVADAEAVGQPGQPPVQPVRDQVRQRR